jgi:hypothetical protein
VATSQKNKKLYASHIFSVITQIYIRISNGVTELRDGLCMIWFKGVSAPVAICL